MSLIFQGPLQVEEKWRDLYPYQVAIMIIRLHLTWPCWFVDDITRTGGENRPWSETCKKWGIIISYVITSWAICQQNHNVDENDENMFSGWRNSKDLSGDVDGPWRCRWESCQPPEEVAPQSPISIPRLTMICWWQDDVQGGRERAKYLWRHSHHLHLHQRSSDTRGSVLEEDKYKTNPTHLRALEQEGGQTRPWEAAWATCSRGEPGFLPLSQIWTRFPEN